jgi:protein-S-isoprenylcysteine O-methyltransferase Ste14
MDTARQVVTLLLVISLPPGLLLWFFIHPFAGVWRRIGAAATYAILAVPCGLLVWPLWAARGRLLTVDYGTSWLLIAGAGLCVLAGGAIARRRGKLLTFGVLAGLPELSAERYPGRLLTEGIYGRIRHPRYVELELWTLGYALFANHLASYAMWLVSLPLLFLIVLLEERELRQRFGVAYEEYCRRVPRFLPCRTAG